jgi:hypothetical protein
MDFLNRARTKSAISCDTPAKNPAFNKRIRKCLVREDRSFYSWAGDQAIASSRFEASLFSPRITVALLADPSLDEYELDIADCLDFDPNCHWGLVSLSRS